MKKRSSYLNLIFWIGLSSLIYEIFSTKVLFLFFLESSQAVTIAITAFLAGLAFSSLIFTNFSKYGTKNNLKIIFWMQISVIIYGYFILKNYVIIPTIIDYLKAHIYNSGLVSLFKITIIWIYLFIPAFFIGGSFPLVNGLYLKEHQEKTRGTGLVYFWDTLGAIIGAFLTGFLFLPQFGFRATVIIAISINLIIAIAITTKKWWQLGLIIIASLIIISEGIYYKNYHNPKIGSQGGSEENKTNNYMEYPELDYIFGDILFQEISPFGRITIGNNTFGEKDNKTLFINYRDMCRSNYHDSEYNMGKLTTMKGPKNSRILNIGFGCGFTANAVASQKNVAHLDIAEINPVIIKGSSKYFKKENGDVLHNPKTILNIIDGAEYIRNTQNQYDGIVIDIEEVSIVYSSPLYSKEYFALAKKKLKPEGVLALWSFSGPPEFEKIIYNTLKSVYKNVSLIKIGIMYTFYASDSIKGLPVSVSGDTPTEAEAQATASLINIPNNEINTLDNDVLEKFFEVRSFFDLPVYYREKFLKEKAATINN